MPEPKNEEWKITVKGFLAFETGLFGKFDPIWDNLTKFVKEEAARNGMTDGVPCLVLVDGGHCITVRKSK